MDELFSGSRQLDCPQAARAVTTICGASLRSTALFATHTAFEASIRSDRILMNQRLRRQNSTTRSRRVGRPHSCKSVDVFETSRNMVARLTSHSAASDEQ